MSGGDAEIFISYAHADNEFPRYESRDWEGTRGWVECFYDALGKMLQRLRRGTQIWRDASGRIKGASALTPTIKDGIEKASILIAIHSPAYAASQWCEDELRFFRESSTARGGLRVGNMLRVFKINLRPAAGESFLTRVPELADNPGYDFFRNVNGYPLEFEPPRGAELGKRFCDAINILASDLVEVLQGRTSPVPATGTRVYLAETAPDCNELRSNLYGELTQFGHTVLPRTNYEHGLEYASRVRAELRTARLSIHAIGESLGESIEGRSIAEIQYDLAGEEALQRSDFSRLTWLVPGSASLEPRQDEFIDRLRSTDASVVVASVEDMKTLIKKHLEVKPLEVKPPARQKTSLGHDVKIVYLVFEPPDEENAAPLKDWLFEQGLEVLEPARTGGVRAHNINLRDSHGALIYYGQVNRRVAEREAQRPAEVRAQRQEAPAQGCSVSCRPARPRETTVPQSLGRPDRRLRPFSARGSQGLR
jgi:hypothetical protein